MKRTEVRVKLGGRVHAIRFDADDPDWRPKALADIDPLSDLAFAIRKIPLTPAEQAATAARFEQWEREL